MNEGCTTFSLSPHPADRSGVLQRCHEIPSFHRALVFWLGRRLWCPSRATVRVTGPLVQSDTNDNPCGLVFTIPAHTYHVSVALNVGKNTSKSNVPSNWLHRSIWWPCIVIVSGLSSISTISMYQTWCRDSKICSNNRRCAHHTISSLIHVTPHGEPLLCRHQPSNHILLGRPQWHARSSLFHLQWHTLYYNSCGIFFTTRVLWVSSELGCSDRPYVVLLRFLSVWAWGFQLQV
jgi:hypothetical protein